MASRKFFAALMFFTVFVSPAFGDDNPASQSENVFAQAITSGKPIIDVRYRFEWKEQDGFADNAYANTVRTRLGFETGEIFHLKFLAEFENVFNIGEDHFNSTTNGLVMFPVIADPDATEVNRAQVTFTGIEKTPITIGRQRFNLNNHRFVGDVDFRQNQQTFDAVRLSSTIIGNLTVDYLYIDKVHRVFGNDHPMGEFQSDSHVISAIYNAGKLGTVKGYGLLLDFKNAPDLSSATWGVRYENNIVFSKEADVSLGLVGEYASQKDYADNPHDYKESYIHGETRLNVSAFFLTGGYERLGGDETIGFSTPLATLHKFQGFADVFLTTPAAGIEDIYGTIGYDWKDFPVVDGIKIFATYHEFESQIGNVDFGNEVDAVLTVKFCKYWTAELKGAVYDGAGAFADRNIAWASLRFQY